MPDDDMGQGNAGVDPNGKSITTKTFQAAATSQNMSEEDAMKFTFELLQKQLAGKK